MSFFDWSDSEGMFGLLIEYASDEKNQSAGDPNRRRFLSKLLADLRQVDQQFQAIDPAEAMHQLQIIQDSIDPDFKEDTVVLHITDCIEELRNIIRVQENQRKK